VVTSVRIEVTMASLSSVAKYADTYLSQIAQKPKKPQCFQR
jgi:hypothetical protein